MTLEGRYHLETELGRGGMGVVYRAHDTLLDRPVAVKVLSRPDLGTEGRARMLREARLAAQLSHPNVVSVHDAGEFEGSPFIVMELVEGQSLHTRWLRPVEEISVSTAFPRGRHACQFAMSKPDLDFRRAVLLSLE